MIFSGVKMAAQNIIANLITGIANTILGGISEMFGNGPISQEENMLNAKVLAAFDLFYECMNEFINAVYTTMHTKIWAPANDEQNSR